MDKILEVEHLKKHFTLGASLFSRNAPKVYAVDDISFDLWEGEALGLVGESGCGKTTLGKSIMRLEMPSSGRIGFLGQDLLKLNKSELRRIRSKMAMIFQDPYASLDPRMTIRAIISEPFEIHGLPGKDCKVEELVRKVGLDEGHLEKFPHQFSGGQRQRIAIARALALSPKLVIADEAVASLDVSVRAAVLNLMTQLREEFRLTYLFISHDLSVVRHMCNRVIVMYLGKFVEEGWIDDLFDNPQHPYTKALIGAVPVPDPDVKLGPPLLKSEVPTLMTIPIGCRFQQRCPFAEEICSAQEPEMKSLGAGHYVACHLMSQKNLDWG